MLIAGINIRKVNGAVNGVECLVFTCGMVGYFCNRACVAACTNCNRIIGSVDGNIQGGVIFDSIGVCNGVAKKPPKARANPSDWVATPD